MVSLLIEEQYFWPLMKGGFPLQDSSQPLFAPDTFPHIFYEYHWRSRTSLDGSLSHNALYSLTKRPESLFYALQLIATIASLTTDIYTHSLLWKLAFIFKLKIDLEGETERKMRFNKMMIDERKLRFVRTIAKRQSPNWISACFQRVKSLHLIWSKRICRDFL